MEKNPAWYQETSWFTGSKTLKIGAVVLRGAPYTCKMGPWPSPPRQAANLLFYSLGIFLCKFNRFYQIVKPVNVS
jgi:hypothetical protein